MTLTGTVTETVEVAVLRRGVARGEIVKASDFETVRIDRRRVSRNAVVDPARLAGLSARRAQRAGEALDPSSFEPPVLVTRNASVTVVYRKPGLTLSARGRALSDGAAGDQVSVLNEQSRRIVHGVVTGSGEVEVISGPITTASLEGAAR
ncbi:flagellar basal body P-ring formation chaperone FlgA [Methylobrevis pamukkalensis]|uniref:Flagella basal body P-ring formation protein FlgA n=1 Tax=Methylobrevis pamukkalensis TaxID=1439726 RepID=A0A1E3GZ51_9HYPH|nr:flagellar basal body P-ring formation chaperone FlgA [Methylobrevis pamukkalensis]ODN69340.1 flagellar basal body P-ring biosynthesis protein FlgA [Methylobrevis pamukkalensis]